MPLVPKFSHECNHFAFWIVHGCRVKWNWDFEDNSKCFLATSLYQQFSLEVNIDGSDGKESACSVGDPGLIPRSGRSSGEGNGNPLQYSCLENSMDRGAWRTMIHGIAKSQSPLTLSLHFLSFWGSKVTCHNFTLDMDTYKGIVVNLAFQ